MHKILIIDDEAPIRKMLKNLLEKNGYEVIQAENGNEGVGKVKEHKPDLIITDIINPAKKYMTKL